MIYEKPRESDLSDISFLFRTSFPKERLSIKASERIIQAYLNKYTTCFVAKDGKDIVGFIAVIDDISHLSRDVKLGDHIAGIHGYFMPAKKKYAKDAFILVTFVAPTHRNKKIASELIRLELKHFSKLHKTIFCQIYDKNTPSIKLVVKFGAKLVETGGIVKKYGIYQVNF